MKVDPHCSSLLCICTQELLEYQIDEKTSQRHLKTPSLPDIPAVCLDFIVSEVNCAELPAAVWWILALINQLMASLAQFGYSI